VDFPSLLWANLTSLVQIYIDHGAGGNAMPNLDRWANLLRALDPAGIALRDLPRALRLSKRALRTRLSWATRHGVAEEMKSSVRLTAHGADIAARWKPVQNAAEEAWRTKTGDGLRACLEQVVSQLPLEHPHYPASYGPADASITGGNGADWKAVPRAPCDTVSFLPGSALLSQAIVAFAMEYEKRSRFAFALATGVIQRVPPEGRPVRGLGHAPGISALVRHGFVRLSGAGAGQTISLTAAGAAVFAAHDDRVRAVETDWRQAFGPARIDALRRALEAIC
jgi:hypothetical protein